MERHVVIGYFVAICVGRGLILGGERAVLRSHPGQAYAMSLPFFMSLKHNSELCSRC